MYRSTEEIGGEIAVLVIVTMFLCFWVFRFSREWARIPADAYAARLVEAVESVCRQPATIEKKEKLKPADVKRVPFRRRP
jgi:hypothetical protein